jgi:hypothetical protein
MTTNKTRRSKKKHLIKHLKNDDISPHDKTKKKHRRYRKHRRHRSHSHSRSVSSWKNHYTYESDNLNTTSISNKNNTNNGNIVKGLKDFLALKKDTK